MAKAPNPTPPEGALISRAIHTVAFYETDAMGVVHHSNYVRFLEDARVVFLAEHDRPYESIVGDGFHVPVTRVAVAYKWPCRFADRVEVSCWLSWARHASFGFAYSLRVGEKVVSLAETDHAIVDLEGRPVRIPEPMRLRMQGWRGTAGQGQP
ncbi:MAG: thioesterase family protein [Polyangiales bacterium]